MFTCSKVRHQLQKLQQQTKSGSLVLHPSVRGNLLTIWSSPSICQTFRTARIRVALSTHKPTELHLS